MPQAADGEGFFWGNDPRVNMKLRERIALQMLNSNRPYPKNIGEGLSAIGDAIGKEGIMRRMMQADLQAQEANRAAMTRVEGGGAAPTIADASNSAGGVSPMVPPPMGNRTAAQVGETVNGQRIYPDGVDSPLDPPAGAERDAAIRTIVAEAGNQPPVGQNAVASVIRNRAVNGGYGGDSAGAVVVAPNQFEPHNTPAGRARMAAINPTGPAYTNAAAALDSAYAGNDPTNGAVNFFSPGAQAALGRPPPAWGRGPGQDIGDHRFFGGRPDPRAAVTAALAAQQGGAGVPQPNPTDAGASSPAPAPAVPTSSPLPSTAAPQAAGSLANSAIQPRPQPQQQIAQAPQPDPGYVMPQQPVPTAPPRVPMSQREARARTELLRANGNEYIERQMMAIIEQEKEVRAYEQSRALEMWKQDIEAHRQRELKREEQIATEAKRRQDYAKQAQEIEAGRAPKVVSIDGTDMVYDPDTKTFRPPPQQGASADDRPKVKMTEAEGKNYGFGSVMLEEGRNLGDAAVLASASNAMRGAIPGVGNYAVSDAYRKANASAVRWVRNKLRDESGATIGTREFADEMRAYFPVPGDKPEDIRAKARARAIAEQSMIDGSGPGRKLFEYDERRRVAREKAERAARGIVDVNSEEEAKALPLGTKFYFNGRTGTVK